MKKNIKPKSSVDTGVQIEINSGGHRFSKTNLTTIYRQGKIFDEYVCDGCGMYGKSFKLGMINIKGYTDNEINECSGMTKTKRLKIIQCTAQGRQFQNLTSGSVHDIIEVPKGENNENGVWVMGIDEPVKVLFHEFQFI